MASSYSPPSSGGASGMVIAEFNHGFGKRKFAVPKTWPVSTGVTTTGKFFVAICNTVGTVFAPGIYFLQVDKTFTILQYVQLATVNSGGLDAQAPPQVQLGLITDIPGSKGTLTIKNLFHVANHGTAHYINGGGTAGLAWKNTTNADGIVVIHCQTACTFSVTLPGSTTAPHRTHEAGTLTVPVPSGATLHVYTATVGQGQFFYA